ncbi:trigger factor [soil metagenome]
MKTTVERLPECRATLRVEIPAERVAAERKKISARYAGQAKIPGFRPGKAPASVIEKRFGKNIESKLRDDLVNEGCRSGVEENELVVLTVDGIAEAEFDADGSFSFLATLTTAPSFEIPEYKGIPVKVPRIEVSDEDIDRAIESYRERLADFKDVEGRPVQLGDLAVIDYSGTIDGQPVGEVLPKATAYLAQNNDYWLKIDPTSFLPGFADQLVGLKAGDGTKVTVTLPDDFPQAEAAGKAIDYSVTIKEIKEQILPEVDDALADKIEPGKSLAELRGSIAEQIRTQTAQKVEQYKADQIVGYLTNQVDFELPAEIVKMETQNKVNEMVDRGQRSGMEDEQLVEQQDQIFAVAGQQARSSVKVRFILGKIATAEKLSVSQLELLARIEAMAARYQTPPKKFIKQLKESNQLASIREGILFGKALEFLKDEAEVTEVDPEELKAEQAAAGQG